MLQRWVSQVSCTLPGTGPGPHVGTTGTRLHKHSPTSTSPEFTKRLLGALPALKVAPGQALLHLYLNAATLRTANARPGLPPHPAPGLRSSARAG